MSHRCGSVSEMLHLSHRGAAVQAAAAPQQSRTRGADVTTGVDLTFRPFVDGDWRETDGPVNVVIDPATEQTVATGRDGTAADVHAAIKIGSASCRERG